MIKAGFGRVDITPPFGTDISGYFHQRLSDGILDPLYANALAVSDDENTVLLIALDYIGVMASACDALRRVVAQRCGVAFENVYVGALHQHTSPCLGSDESGAAYALKDGEFIDVVQRRIADAAKMALDDMREARLGVAAKETAEPVGFVRRYFVEGGAVKTNPSTTKYKILRRTAESDNTVRILRFFRDGANDIALINFSTHPDVIGGTKYSADWPGFTRRFVEKDIPGVSAVFFLGCHGDSNHIDFFKPKEERIKGGNGYTHSEYMGRTVADAVIAAWDGVTPCDDGGVAAVSRSLYAPTRADGMEKREVFEKWFASADNNEDRGPIPEGASVATATRIANLKNQPLLRRLTLAAVRIGGAILFGIGGEAFAAYGQKIRDIAPDRFVICTSCTDGYDEYIPTADDYKYGGYEIDEAFYPPEIEEMILAAAKEMIKEL